MVEANIDQSQKFDSSTQGILKIVEKEAVKALLADSTYYKSTISRSEAEFLISLMLPGVAILTPPVEISGSGNGTKAVQSAQTVNIAGKVTATESDIIFAMWNTFSEGLHHIAEVTKAESKSQEMSHEQLKIESQHKSYLQDQIKTGATNLENRFNDTFSAWLTPNNTNTVASLSDYPSSSFIAGATLISADMIRNAIGSVDRTMDVQLSLSPVADALSGVGPSSGLPGDYQAAAALIAAILYNGALFRATAETTNNANLTEKNPEDLDFALNFAKNILNILTTNIANTEKTDPQSTKQNQFMRLMLAAIAVNMVYRLAYGGMTGLELLSLLKGNTSDLPSLIKPTIDRLIALINSSLPTDPIERNAAVASLSQYIDHNNPVKNMLKTTHTFSAMLKARTAINEARDSTISL